MYFMLYNIASAVPLFGCKPSFWNALLSWIWLEGRKNLTIEGLVIHFFPWFCHCWAPQCMRRKKMRNMITRACLLKCVEGRGLNSSKMAFSYLPSYCSFMPDLHLSHPDSCGSPFTQKWRNQVSG